MTANIIIRLGGATVKMCTSCVMFKTVKVPPINNEEYCAD